MALDILSEIAHLQSEMNRAGLILANDGTVRRSAEDKARLGREFSGLSPRFVALSSLVSELLDALQAAQAALPDAWAAVKCNVPVETLQQIEAVQAKAKGIAPVAQTAVGGA